MNKSLLLILLVGVLSGCKSGSVMDKVSGLIPGGFDDDKPYLEQVGDQRKPALNGIGVDQDRLRAQSQGRGLIDAPRLEALMNEHLERLKQASGMAGLEGRAYISAEHGFAARTSADGNIYIPIGMLNDLENSHQLAALLAHELTHAMLNHPDSDMMVTVQKKALLFASLAAGFKQDDTAGLSPKDQRRIRNVLAMTLVSDGFLNPGWTRGQEEAADRLGTDLLVAAGYNPEAMNILLQKLAAWEERNATIKAVREEQRTQVLATAGEAQVPMQEIVDQATGALATLLTKFSDSHPSPEARLTALQTYIGQHHRRAARPPMPRDRWSRAIQSAEAKALLRAVNAVSEAETALAANQPGKASRLVLSQVNQHTRQQTFLRQALAAIRDAQGQPASVLANLRYGLKGQYPSYRVVFEYNIRARNGKVDGPLLSRLHDAFTKYGKPPEYYPKLITVADRVGNTGLKSALQIECRVSYFGEAVACNPDESASDQEISYNAVIDKLL